MRELWRSNAADLVRQIGTRRVSEGFDRFWAAVRSGAYAAIP